MFFKKSEKNFKTQLDEQTFKEFQPTLYQNYFETKSKIVNGLNRLPRPLVNSQVLSQIKIYFSTDLFPIFINNDQITNPLTLLPKLQGNTYDDKLLHIIEESLKIQ